MLREDVLEVVDGDTKAWSVFVNGDEELVVPPTYPLLGEQSCMAALDSTRILRSGGIIPDQGTTPRAHILDVETKSVG